MPATQKISDRSQGRAAPLRAQGRAFQLMEEEARTTQDVAVGMFLSFILLIISFYAYMFLPVIRYIFNELHTCFGII